MLHFFIKSTICFTVLFLFYKLFLEREKMHQFNRFYLMGVLILSIVIPSCSFYINSSSIISVNSLVHQMTSSTLSNNLNTVLLFVYGFGLIIFGLRLFKNLKEIHRRINKNTILLEHSFNLVLIKEKLLPHTFLNYVFINEDDYKENNIHEELFYHEQVHVSQKHSVDIILSEIFQVLFWFNPLIPSIKHAIKLNHEFLADEEVIKTFNNTSNYQHILLDIVSQPYKLGLTSNLNYSLTKRRFNMMLKTGSKNTRILFKVLLIPVFLFSLIAFSEITLNEEHLNEEHSKSISEFSISSEHGEEDHH